MQSLVRRPWLRALAIASALAAASSTPTAAAPPPAPAESGSLATTCEASNETLCLLAGRFALSVEWRNPYDGSVGAGRALVRSDFTGFFSFGDPANVELIVKVLDFGGTVKVFYGQLTDFDFTLSVRDTRDGSVRTYGPTPGDCGAIDQGGSDQGGFASVAMRVRTRGGSTRPTGTSGSCVPDGRTLCLQGNRFAARVTWRNPYNGARGEAVAAPLGDLTGLFTYDDPRNVELLVKTLVFGDRLLVIYGALSDFAYDLTVTDTATGRERRYSNPGGRYCGGLDPDALGVRFVPLGELAGGAVRSEAYAVSADGRVVVGVSASASSGATVEAFRWREGEGMAGLGDLVGGTFDSFAQGVSPDGAFALGRGTRSEGPEAVTWNLSGVLTPLGDTPGGAFSSRARASSSDNTIIVGDSDGPSGTEAVRWVNGAISGLGDLPGGPFGSGAVDVSADGSTIVGFGHLEADILGFRWTEATGMVSLGDLPGGQNQSSPQAVSADGRSVVGNCNTAVGSEGCRWVDGGGPERLGDPPLAGAQSTALDVAADGGTIVGSYVTATERHAYLWTASAGLRDLQTELAALSADGLAGWVLESATSVSADGLTIVGWGRDPTGARQAWLARLPQLPQ
jgi:probable HAF family extracellular repeat protein